MKNAVICLVATAALLSPIPSICGDAKSAELAKALPQMLGKSKDDLRAEFPEIVDRIQQQNHFENPGDGNYVWHVWQYSDAKESRRYIVFSAYPLMVIPGSSGATIRIYSDEGAELKSWYLNSGYREDLVRASFDYVPQLKARAIVIHTKRDMVAHGREKEASRKQYYALDKDELYLARIENSSGEADRNDYRAYNFALGSYIVDKTAAEWLKELESESIAKRLAALTFLGSSFRDPNSKPPDYAPPGGLHPTAFELPVNVGATARTLRQNTKVVELIEEYLKSESEWMRQAAHLAKEPVFESD